MKKPQNIRQNQTDSRFGIANNSFDLNYCVIDIDNHKIYIDIKFKKKKN